MELPRRPLAVVFDMDGLIFDTEQLYQEAIMAAADEVRQPMTADIFRAMIGRPWLRTREFLVGHYGPSFAVDDFRAAWNRHFEVIVATRLSLKPGVVELLDTLDQLSLPRAIATLTTPSSTIWQRMTLLGAFIMSSRTVTMRTANPLRIRI